MTKVSSIEALRSIHTRRKFASSNGYGEAIYGFSLFGTDNPFAGIYRRRPSSSGISIVKTRFYRPPVSRTEAQATQRDKMLAAMSAWHDLSDSERQEWRDKYVRRSKRGVDVFKSNYIKTH